MKKKTQPSHGNDIGSLYEKIRDIEVGMFTSVGPKGVLHTRPMITRLTDSRNELWFFAVEDSATVREINKNNQVSVTYSDVSQRFYAAVSGQAELVRDSDRIDALWSTELRVWLPEGREEPGLLLIRVKIQSAEYWRAPSDTMVEVIAAVQAEVDAPASGDAGGHDKIELT